MADLSKLASELSPVVTAIGVVIALVSAQRTLKTNRSKNRADWMFQATLTFHREARLYDLFHEIDYDRYELVLEPLSENGELGTKKEKDLIFFLDFLNGVCAAFEANIMDEEYLIMSSLGYAVRRTADNKVVKAYLEHLNQHDKDLGFNVSYRFRWFRRPRKFRAFEHFQDASRRIDGLRGHTDSQTPS